MLITVFTPTYNRAHLLYRVYESLCNQTFKDFEWLIVDDGSTDGTENLPFIKDTSEVNIRYIKQLNGGKHRAINRGVKEAKGELFFILDSDDWLPTNSLQIVCDVFYKHNQTNICGVCGLDAYQDGTIVGDMLPFDEIIANTMTIKYNYRINGDKKEVYKTQILRNYPFPEVDGEFFCPESLIWNRIAKCYDMVYINKVIYNVEYQVNGLTANILLIRMRCPIASTLCYYERNRFPHVPMLYRIKDAINYWRFKFCIRNKNKIVPLIRWYWWWVMPLGFLIHLYDIMKVKQLKNIK